MNDADKAKAIAEVEELAQAKDAIDQAASQAQVQALLLDQALADIAAVNPAANYVPCQIAMLSNKTLLLATRRQQQSFFSAAALAVLSLGLVASGKRRMRRPLS